MVDTEIKICPGKFEHIDKCLSIARSLPDYFNADGLAKMARDLKHHDLFVAIQEETIVGFATILKKNISVAEISWMAIQKQCQHKGIGSALMHYLITDLQSKKLQLLIVKTLAENIDYQPYEITRRFYKKHHFFCIETIDPYPEWGKGNPCSIYAKIL